MAAARSWSVREFIRRAIVFLLLGAVVNVAVALTFSWAAQEHLIRARGIVSRSFSHSYTGPIDPSGSWSAALHVNLRAGFPVQSLAGHHSWDRTGADPKKPGYHSPDPPVHVIILYSPIWPGFAINTIFYAAIIALLWFAPGMIRRRIRIRRGRCPACGYPIGMSDVCTECGSALPRRAEAAT